MFDYDSDEDEEPEELEEHEPTAPETIAACEHKGLGPTQVRTPLFLSYWE